MVSYYNPLSPAMFPNPPQMGGVARHQPTSASAAAAAAAAAGHAYFHNYHAHAAAAYGHPAVSHNYGQYAANLAADLNSNMYNGGQNTQFPSSNENWTASAASAASQWPSFGHNPPTTTSTAVTAPNGGCRFDLWPQNSDDSPPTPTNNETTALTAAASAASVTSSNNIQRPVSPGNYGTTHSHSSGSPSGTPTPGAQSSYADMQFNKFNINANTAASNFGGQPQPQQQQPQHSPNAINPAQCGSVLDSSSPLNSSHLEQHPMASPVASSLASPTSRPQPARSPYEWMKKPSYQCQPEKSGE